MTNKHDEVNRIREAARELDALAETATDKILEFEGEMEDLRPGVQAWFFSTIVGEPQIGYVRKPNGWRVVVGGPRARNIPLVDAPRELRIAGATRLDQLRTAILEAVEEALRKAQEAAGW